MVNAFMSFLRDGFSLAAGVSLGALQHTVPWSLLDAASSNQSREI
jgi:hypothetical protein